MPLRRAALQLLLVLAGAGCQIRSHAHLGPLVERSEVIVSDDVDHAAVEVTFYAGKVKLRGGGDELLALTARDNVVEFEPRIEVERDGRQASVRAWLASEARVDVWEDGDTSNEWDVRLGERVPQSLQLELGMCSGDIDFGGAALRRATVSAAMGKVDFTFSRPNPVDLEQIDVELGAGDFSFRQLGNAGCAASRFDLSGGGYRIDLDGDWRRPGLVRIEARLCQVEVRVPSRLRVRVDGRDCGAAELEVDGVAACGDGIWQDALAEGAAPDVVLELDAKFANVTIVRD